MVYRFVTLCCFWLLAQPVFAWKQPIDSLQNELKKYSRLDTVRVQLLNQLGFEYWIVDPNKSEEYGLQAIELSRILAYDKGMAFAERIVGVAHWARGNYDPGLEYLFKSMDLYQQ